MHHTSENGIFCTRKVASLYAPLKAVALPDVLPQLTITRLHLFYCKNTYLFFLVSSPTYIDDAVMTIATEQREAREGYGLIKFIFLPCSRFPSCSLIFLIGQIARLYSLILELHNLSQVREESC